MTRPAGRALLIVGWTVVGVGLCVMAAVLVHEVFHDRIDLAALSSAGAGLAVVLIGVLDLLAASRTTDVRLHQRVRLVAGLANLAGLPLAVGLSVLQWRDLQGPALVILFVSAAILVRR